MVKSTWSENLKKTLNYGRISWAPCNEIVWGLLQLGPGSPCSPILFTWTIFFSFYFRTPRPHWCGHVFVLMRAIWLEAGGTGRVKEKAILSIHQKAAFGGDGGGEIVSK